MQIRPPPKREIVLCPEGKKGGGESESNEVQIVFVFVGNKTERIIEDDGEPASYLLFHDHGRIATKGGFGRSFSLHRPSMEISHCFQAQKTLRTICTPVK